MKVLIVVIIIFYLIGLGIWFMELRIITKIVADACSVGMIWIAWELHKERKEDNKRDNDNTPDESLRC